MLLGPTRSTFCGDVATIACGGFEAFESRICQLEPPLTVLNTPPLESRAKPSVGVGNVASTIRAAVGTPTVDQSTPPFTVRATSPEPTPTWRAQRAGAQPSQTGNRGNARPNA